MRYRIALLLVGLLSWPLLTMASAPPGREPKVLFEEEFAGSLDKGWSWVREFPPAWRLENDTLILDILPGSLWLNENGARNLLLRPVPVVDRPGFVAEVLLDCEPARQFEYAGLICYFDDDNWVAINKEYTTRTELVLLSENKGVPVLPADGYGYAKSAVRLRMAVAGGKVVASFRDPRRGPWYLIGECPLPASSKQLLVGLASGYGTKNGERKARFSEFRIIEGTR